jgi:hypothetical protein
MACQSRKGRTAAHWHHYAMVCSFPVSRESQALVASAHDLRRLLVAGGVGAVPTDKWGFSTPALWAWNGAAGIPTVDIRQRCLAL